MAATTRRAGDEDAPIAIDAVRPRDEFLQIVGPVHLIVGREIADSLDQAQAFALRAEQRLLHQGHALPARGLDDRLGLIAAGAAPGPGRRDACLLQDEGGGGFVDAALDGARIVPHPDPKLAQRMEHAEIKRDLLEAPARNEQHQRAARQMVAESRDSEPGPRRGREPACRQRHRERGDPARFQRTGDAPPMPLLALAEEEDVGSHGSAE